MQKYLAKYLTKSVPTSFGLALSKYHFGYVVGDNYHKPILVSSA